MKIWYKQNGGEKKEFMNEIVEIAKDLFLSD